MTDKTSERSDKNRVLIFDTTLRDGDTRQHKTVELFRATQFHVGTNLYAVPCLHHRIQAFVQEDGLFLAVSFSEVFSCKQLSNRDSPAQRQDIGKCHCAEPVAVAMHFGAGHIHDFTNLSQIRRGVDFNFRFGQPFAARFITSAGIADESGVVSDDNDSLMPQLLKLPHLAKRHGVSKMDVDPGRVDPVLDSQRSACVLTVLQLPAEFVLRHDFIDAAGNDLKLFFNGWKSHGHQSIAENRGNLNTQHRESDAATAEA